MKKTSTQLFLVLLWMLSFTSCSNEVDEINSFQDMAQLLEKNITIAKKHSKTIEQIKTELITTKSADPEYPKEYIYKLYQDYIIANNLPQNMLTENNKKKIIESSLYKEEVCNYFGEDCLKNMLNAIEQSQTIEELKNTILQVLQEYKDSKYIESYLAIAGVAVDSYSYWTEKMNNKPQSRSAWSTVGRIIEADAISAGTTIECLGAAAIFTGATPPGAATIAGAAAFGSAFEGCNMLFENTISAQ